MPIKKTKVASTKEDTATKVRKTARKAAPSKTSAKPAARAAKKTSRAKASTSKTPVKKTTAKTTGSSSRARKVAAKTVKTKKTTTSGNPRKRAASDAFELDRFGMRANSDLSIAAAEMVKGGTTKHEVAERIFELLPEKNTRQGQVKAPASIMGQAAQRLTKLGYVVTGSWKMSLPRATKVSK